MKVESLKIKFHKALKNTKILQHDKIKCIDLNKLYELLNIQKLYHGEKLKNCMEYKIHLKPNLLNLKIYITK